VARLQAGFEQHIVEPAGLDLASDPLDSECLYAMNVTFRHPGRVGPRNGYESRGTSISPADGNVFCFEEGATTYAIYRRSSTSWYATPLDSGSDITYAIAASNAPPVTGATRVDTPTGSAMYLAAGWETGALYGLRKFDGTTFTAPAGTAPTIPPDPNLAQRAAINDVGTSSTTRMPAAWHVATAPWDNSLVAAATDGGLSRIEFSVPGKPEVWQVNSYEDFSPGDGEPILGMAAWRDKVFVFKQTKFRVYYTTTYNSDGLPEYQSTTYYNQPGVVFGGTVDTDAMVGKVCAAADGVYYISDDGVYRTTGREPIKVSGQIEPLWTSRAGSIMSGVYSTSSLSDHQRIAEYQGQIIVARRLYHQGNTLAAACVYHVDSKRWSTWVIRTDATHNVLTGIARGSYGTEPAGALVFLLDDLANPGDAVLGRMDDSQAYDYDSWDIVCRYWTGLLDLGSPNEKVLREVIIDASEARAWDNITPNPDATVYVTVSNPTASDASAVLYTASSDTSTSPISALRHRRSYRGRWFQVKLTDLNVDLHRLRLMLGSTRGSSMDAET